jgi:hypothetical protein
MRKVVAVELVSQDGVMESPEEWAFSYSNDEMEEANASGMAASAAATGLKPHLSSQSGGCANYLSRGSDPEHHPFTLDLCLVRLATVLVGQFVDVLSRLLTLDHLYYFPAHFDEAIGIFHIPDRDRHPRVAFDVAKLLAVHLGIDQEMLIVSIDPHHLSLRMAGG